MDSCEGKNLAEREKKFYYLLSKIYIYKDSTFFNLPATKKIGQDLQAKIPMQKKKNIISSEMNPLTLEEEET